VKCFLCSALSRHLSLIPSKVKFLISTISPSPARSKPMIQHHKSGNLTIWSPHIFQRSFSNILTAHYFPFLRAFIRLWTKPFRAVILCEILRSHLRPHFSQGKPTPKELPPPSSSKHSSMIALPHLHLKIKAYRSIPLWKSPHFLHFLSFFRRILG